ncbi:hypothetical protein GCM10008904_05300 [Paraclostridium ghonii]|uniref:Uncharacterized protein n=1 Tax=Paraclostridium ghonii TaxID=29358 RepID=A0ABU0N272_9FIRM|nr:hypothetical protein [Paeniclostridium ghonii]MCM0167005.1 hypothetical protein [Paeniclostridium ghonii]MDQ0557264.1 hypothetical protein [Paeniclostridium ghonii]
MKDNSFLDSVKGIFKEMLYMESENTNTDREKITEIDKYGNKTTYYRAGAGPEQPDKINQKFE